MSIPLQDMGDAISQLEAARSVLQQLRGLFVAIGKLGNDDTADLAGLGVAIAEDWANVLDVDVERFSGLFDSARDASSGRSGGDAYDDATLALEKAQTLATMLMTIGGQSAQTAMDAGTLGRAFTHLVGELADVRDGLTAAHRLGDAQ